MTPLDEIPAICTITDICRLLRLSRAQFHRLRQQGRFPIPELPKLDRRVRFAGAHVRAYVTGQLARTGRRGR